MKFSSVTAALTALSMAAITPAALAQDDSGDAVYGESGIDESSYDQDVYGDGGAGGADEISYEASGAEEAGDTEYAYQGEERQLEEVVVTVERRTQNLQDLGGTAISFDGEALKQLGVVDVTDLAELVPGLTVGNNQGNIEIWIRGVGSSNNTELGDPAAATHLEGVYLPRPAGIGSGFFDIQRVEVNIGPQGTLRGRNATAGSVNIIPWRPGLGIFDMSAEAGYGNYDQTEFQGVVNAPLGDNAAIRVAGYFLEHDSYYEDVGPLNLGVAEAASNWALRGQVLWEPTEKLRFYASADTLNEGGTGWTGSNYANPLGNGIDPEAIEDPRKVVARAFEPVLDTKHWGTKFEVKYDFGWADFEYSFGYRDLVYDYEAATPLTPFYPGVFDTLQPPAENFDNWSRFQILTDSESTTHEVRLVSPQDQFVYWTVGAFFFEEQQYTFLGSTGDRTNFFQGTEFNQPDTDATSESYYADVTFNFTPNWRFTAGARYTSDEKTRVGVNARYALALGGAGFSCCMGARFGTEGFSFAERGRTIIDPDTDGDGTVSEQEIYDFWDDGVASYGARDNVDDILAAGPQGGGAPLADRPDCVDTTANDGLDCPPDGKHSFAVPFLDQINVQDGKGNWSFVDWRARLEHNWREDSLAYFMVSTGHKSGGFNDNIPGTDLAPEYDEEFLVVYELGSKNDFELFDIPMRLNASAFYYDYEDLVLNALVSVTQALSIAGIPVGVVDPGVGALVVNFNFNAANAEIYGLQLDGQVELPWELSFKWSALWLEANVVEADEIQDFRFQSDVAPLEAVNRPINGKRLPRTPEYQINMSLSQAISLPWGRFDWIFSSGWRDEQFMTIFNGEDYRFPDNPRKRLDDRVEAYWTFDAGVGFTHNGLNNVNFEAYVNNLTDEVQPAALIITQFDNTRFFTRPRTFGVRVRWRY